MEYRTRRLGKNTIIVFLGRASSSLIGLLMLPFYTHWLSPSDYGTADLVFTYTSIMVSVISCCLADAVFIYGKSATEDDRKKYYSSGILFLIGAFILSGLLTMMLKITGLRFQVTNVIFKYAWFIWAITICNILQLYTQSFTQAIDKMTVFTLTGVVFTLSITLSSVAFLPILGLKGYLWAYVLANLSASVFSMTTSKSYKYISLNKFDKQKCIELLSYGIPIIPNTIMWWLVSGINRPIMESTLGLASVGLFAVANKIPGVISMLCGIFNTAWNITMLEEYGKKDFNEFFNKIVKSIFFVLVLVGAVVSIFSKEIVSIFAAEEYFTAWKYLPFLVFSALLQNLSGLIGGVFSAQKKSKYFFYTSIWGAVTSLLFTYLLIPSLGLYGVCVAMILSFLSMIISRLKYAWKEIDSFDIIYYLEVSLLYLALAVIIISALRPIVKIIAYLVIISIIIFLNREMLQYLKSITFLKLFIKK